MPTKIDIQKECKCQFTGEYCQKLAEEAALFVNYYQSLADKARNGKGGTDIFTNGGEPICCDNTCGIYRLYKGNGR
ncbi:MAG: hypothetical protein J6T57_00820 [Alphaproteobacteria bacterium]|nr:hypothetical protein [Alphaproteobacteria bacterium]